MRLMCHPLGETFLRGGVVQWLGHLVHFDCRECKCRDVLSSSTRPRPRPILGAVLNGGNLMCAMVKSLNPCAMVTQIVNGCLDLQEVDERPYQPQIFRGFDQA